MNEARTKRCRSRVHWRPARMMIKILMWQHNRVFGEADRSPTELERSANFRRIVLGETSSCEQRGAGDRPFSSLCLRSGVHTDRNNSCHIYPRLYNNVLTCIYIGRGSHKALSLFVSLFFIFSHLPFALSTSRFLTSNCQCAACNNCLACSLAQPAASTNWLIITCSRRVSILFVTTLRFNRRWTRKRRQKRRSRLRMVEGEGEERERERGTGRTDAIWIKRLDAKGRMKKNRTRLSTVTFQSAFASVATVYTRRRRRRRRRSAASGDRPLVFKTKLIAGGRESATAAHDNVGARGAAGGAVKRSWVRQLTPDGAVRAVPPPSCLGPFRLPGRVPPLSAKVNIKCRRDEDIFVYPIAQEYLSVT